ncbi:UNVERIFIED_ORG: hypothetical protein M2438_001890 [Methylobacterium sp. SuP10 SLI 274]|nr:hypothetical protein [Methylorubrum extorquens]MDF9791408.1 hypothetical protein [Methylorubrum extorquens]MDF9863103.1 hypothetical protein [Methylorubrum pseudosasae]MDH6636715.1 hypothetical protein [Methylobacterium sp. SuP10 SLI 274]MDH6665892.1 hypothetical protein [Methylorubrum zatmanii]
MGRLAFGTAIPRFESWRPSQASTKSFNGNDLYAGHLFPHSGVTVSTLPWPDKVRPLEKARWLFGPGMECVGLSLIRLGCFAQLGQTNS